MGWMMGSPPPLDKQIRFSDSSFSKFPRTRWLYAHMRLFLPTSVVPRGGAAVCELPRAERTDLDAVTFMPMGRTEPMTWRESLLANYTDAIVVLHRGTFYERRFGVMDEHTPHIAYSVTKSFVATLAQTLVHDGVLDDQAPVPTYLPELAASGYADATVRQLLDMTTGLRYTEDYVDENSSIRSSAGPGGFRRGRPAIRGRKRSTATSSGCRRRARTASDSPTRRSTPIRSGGFSAA